jgi:hypothetical protein
MSAGALNVNVACLACDGTRPCAQCRAVGKALAGAGHRVHRSSRYAALRAAADGTYGFSACVMPLAPGERSVADAIVALMPDARVAIATDDAAVLPERLPEGFVSFSRADFLAGRLPRAWLDALSLTNPTRQNVASERSSADSKNAGAGLSSGRSSRSDATRRLRAIAITHRTMELDARALLDDELAWYRASGIGFALVRMHFTGARQPSKQTLVESLRAGDSVAAADGELVIVLPGADALQAEQICARATKRMLKRQRELKAKDVRTGIAICPHDGDSAAELLAKAKKHL